MEGRGIEEAGWLRRAAGFEEGRAEDRGGLREVGWYQGSKLR